MRYFTGQIYIHLVKSSQIFLPSIKFGENLSLFSKFIKVSVHIISANILVFNIPFVLDMFEFRLQQVLWL